MKTYVVNLPQSRDRREHILAECARFGLEPEIFPAVYGRDLTEEELRLLVDALALEVFGKAEIGCALSHLGIYRDMIAKNIPVAFILEDDSVLTRDPHPVLDGLTQTAGSGDAPEAYLLTRNRESDQMIAEKNGENAARMIGGCRFYPGWRGFGTYGYAITRQAAANILALQTPVKFAADWWKVFRTFGILRFFLCEADIVGIHGRLGTESMVSDDRGLEKGRSRKNYILRQTPLLRTARYYLDKLRYGRRIKKLT